MERPALATANFRKQTGTVAGEPAPLFLYQKLQELREGEKMVLVPTAPLTNIALLLKTFPDAAKKLTKLF